MEVLMLAWFFVTPIIWDARVLPEVYAFMGIALPIRRLVYILNPMASIIASYRDTLYWGTQPALDLFVRSAATRNHPDRGLPAIPPFQFSICRGALRCHPT
jgi:ABC-type polysaccharide/polyol phosphate export permease